MKKFQYASDLHLEFNSDYLSQNPLVVDGDVLLLAGDIGVWGDKFFQHPFWKWCSEHYSMTYMVLGNHEFYSGVLSVEETYESFEYKILPNVIILNNKSVVVDDCELFFTTLWSDLNEQFMDVIQLRLSDFRLIKWFKNQGDERKKYDDAHRICSNWLYNSVKSSNAQHKIVITHHCPLLFPSPFEDKSLYSCFTTDMSPLIKEIKIDYWIYGHTHINQPDSTLNGCIVTSNQLGYVFQNEHKLFNPSVSIPKKTSFCLIV